PLAGVDIARLQLDNIRAGIDQPPPMSPSAGQSAAATEISRYRPSNSTLFGLSSTVPATPRTQPRLEIECRLAMGDIDPGLSGYVRAKFQHFFMSFALAFRTFLLAPNKLPSPSPSFPPQWR